MKRLTKLVAKGELRRLKNRLKRRDRTIRLLHGAVYRLREELEAQRVSYRLLQRDHQVITAARDLASTNMQAWRNRCFKQQEQLNEAPRKRLMTIAVGGVEISLSF